MARRRDCRIDLTVADPAAAWSCSRPQPPRAVARSASLQQPRAAAASDRASESGMCFRCKQSQGRVYLQIVESQRSGDAVLQRVIATLGRLDELEASGQLDRLLRSDARFVQQALVLDAARNGAAPTIASDHRPRR